MTYDLDHDLDLAFLSLDLEKWVSWDLPDLDVLSQASRKEVNIPTKPRGVAGILLYIL